MSTQRFVLLLLAIIGIAATFMPWYTVENIGNLTGVSTSGWFTFIMFILIFFVTMRRNTRGDMSYGQTWLVAVLGIAAGTVVMWRIFDIYFAQDTLLGLSGNLRGITGNQIALQYGIWLVIAAGFGMPVCGFLFRRRIRS